MKFAVIGHPIAHSQSPALHGAAYRTLGLSHSYEALRVTEADLAAVVGELREGAYDGLNVTVPHKIAVLALADELDESARAAGAANTLVRRDGRVVAHNTDVPALTLELRKLAAARAPEVWPDAPALVLGTGGAARAAVASLTRGLGVSRVVVRGRAFQGARGAELAKQFAACAGPHATVVCEPAKPSHEDAEVLTLVQATSAGMTRGGAPDSARTSHDDGETLAQCIDWSHVHPDAVAYDVIYTPPQTPFLRLARARGLLAANGLGMLAEQGAAAFELWLAQPAPRDAMRAALGLKI